MVVLDVAHFSVAAVTTIYGAKVDSDSSPLAALISYVK